MSRLIPLSITFVLLAHAASVAQDWPTYVNETATRMPTGPGMNDPAVSVSDSNEKHYAWGDVDQDGDIDLVCVRKQPYNSTIRRRNVLFLNEGIAEGHAVNGVLIDRTAEYVTDATDGGQGFLDLTNDRDVALVDVDGDGWLDIVTATTYGQGLSKTISHPRVYINLRELDGAWQGFRYEEARTPTLPMEPNFCGLGFGDVTGNGFPDLYFIEYNNDLEDRLWINDGAGCYSDESELRLTFEMRESEFGVIAVIADMNGDGLQDIVKDRANGAPYRISISYNDPDQEGIFDAFETVYSGSPYFVAVADLNNDGLLDIVLEDDGIDRYYLNQGNGPDGLADFLGFTFPPQSNGFEGTIELADLNNDSFIDVLVADETVNGVGMLCGRHMLIWRNLGDVPEISFEEASGGIPVAARTGTFDVAPIDIDGDGWTDLVIGTCSGTSVWMSQPPLGVNFGYPDGIPDIVATDGSTVLHVAIDAVGDSLDPSSPAIHIRVNGGAFESLPLMHIADNLYSASFGAHDCFDRLEFYLSAQLSEGSEFTDPPDAPAMSYRTMVANGLEVALDEHFEGDVSGWTIVSDPSLTTGEWEQADPNGTIFGGELAAPEDDATEGGVMAFVTENGMPGAPAGANDVDGGATYLLSPVFDLDGADARIRYARWFFSASGTPDKLSIEISTDGGESWTLVEQVETTESAWEEGSFIVSDHAEPAAATQVRFTASDFDASITEAGLDDFRVEIYQCEDPCMADLDMSGGVGASDLAILLGAWGPNPGHPADFNGDGTVGAADLAQLLGDWGPCT